MTNLMWLTAKSAEASKMAMAILICLKFLNTKQQNNSENARNKTPTARNA